MKYINLLPLEAQTRLGVSQLRIKPSLKGIFRYLTILALVFVIFGGGMMLVQYRHKQRVTGIAYQGEKHSSPTIAKSPTLVVVPSKKVTPQQSNPAPVTPNKPVSPKIAVPAAYLPHSDGVNKKKTSYTLRLASFTTKDEAKVLMEKMRDQELVPYKQVRQIVKKVNTVYAGQAPTMEEAMELNQRLEADGFESVIKIRPQGAYWVGVKTSPSRVKAQELAERLLGLGYSAKVVLEQAPLLIYQVNLGHYKEYRQAKWMQNMLEEQGYRLISIIKE